MHRPTCKQTCGRRVKTARATLCRTCVRNMAVNSGRKLASNARAKGHLGNAGNAQAKGNQGNVGNLKAKGKLGNNPKKGAAKKQVGKRSGVRRSAYYVCIIKKPWLDLILSGDKT